MEISGTPHPAPGTAGALPFGPLIRLGEEFVEALHDGVDAIKSLIHGPPPPSPHDTQIPFVGTPATYVKGAGDANDVDYNDVSQGVMGDCYFEASVAAIARENPDRIRNLIQENRDAAGNVTSYTVTLYQRDWANDLRPVRINVDPSQFSQHAARPGDEAGAVKEIWPLVLEKAFAQLKGSYSRIADGGSPERALETLTGQDACRFKPHEYAFGQLENDLAHGRPITAMTPSSPDGEKQRMLDDSALHSWHTYAVIDSKVQDGTPMVKLYNPWGDNHPGALKDGWMSFADFQKNMSEVEVGGRVVSLADLQSELQGFTMRLFSHV
jgi:hypothetical protein